MDSVVLKFVPIAAAFILLTYIARRKSKTWLSPGTFFSFYWSVAACVPLFFSPYNKVNQMAVIWIFISTAVFGLSDILLSGIRNCDKGNRHDFSFSRVQILFTEFITICCIILGVAAVIVTLKNAAETFEFFFSTDTLIDAAKKLSHERYNSTYRTGLSQFLSLFVYAAPLLSGFLISVKRDRRLGVISLLSFIPAVLMTAIMTLRGYFIISIIFWISSYLAMQIVKGEYRLFTKKNIVFTISISSAVIVLSAIASIFRYSIKYVGNIYITISHCVLSHMEVFSDWYTAVGLDAKPTIIGSYTFAGIYNAIGIRTRSTSLFDEVVRLSNGKKSNIYTIFRGLMEDFTPMGSLLILFIISILLKWIFKEVTQGKIVYMPILAAFYSTVLWSFTCSIWIWNSAIASYLLLMITFLIALHIDKLIFLEKMLPKERS